jgi:hypothetical protein
MPSHPSDPSIGASLRHGHRGHPRRRDPTLGEGALPSGREEHRKKKLRAVVSHEEFAALKYLAWEPGVSPEELVKRSLAANRAEAKAKPALVSQLFLREARTP